MDHFGCWTIEIGRGACLFLCQKGMGLISPIGIEEEGDGSLSFVLRAPLFEMGLEKD